MYRLFDHPIQGRDKRVLSVLEQVTCGAEDHFHDTYSLSAEPRFTATSMHVAEIALFDEFVNSLECNSSIGLWSSLAERYL